MEKATLKQQDYALDLLQKLHDATFPQHGLPATPSATEKNRRAQAHRFYWLVKDTIGASEHSESALNTKQMSVLIDDLKFSNNLFDLVRRIQARPSYTKPESKLNTWMVAADYVVRNSGKFEDFKALDLAIEQRIGEMVSEMMDELLNS